MENDVYLCSWSRSTEGYFLWVKARPQLRAEGLSYEEAEARLIEAIQSAGGAMQAALEFDPPLTPSSIDARFNDPGLYLIVGDDRFETDVAQRQPFETVEELDERLKQIDAYYQSRVCRTCKWASTPRSEKPLSLIHAPGRYHGAFGAVGSEGGPEIQLLSEEFLQLLSPQERKSLQLRLVKRRGRGRTFYELSGPGGPPFVAVAGLEIRGWRCARCDHCTWGYWIDGMSIHSFVAGSDLPPSLAQVGIFTVGTPPEIRLAVTSERWRELLSQKGTHGLVSQPLGVVPDREVVRRPELPTLEAR